MSASSDHNYNYLVKYIIIGDASVGKSNLVLRFVQDDFKDGYNATIGVEFGAKNLTINDQVFRVHIWDTGGQECFRSITRNYYQNAAACLVVYDITNRDTFRSCQSWIDECQNLTQKNVVIVLVGNKCDLETERKVNTDEGQQLADENNILFYETSAKTGENVLDVFNASCGKISDIIKNKQVDINMESNGIKLGTRDSLLEKTKPQKKNTGCC